MIFFITYNKSTIQNSTYSFPKFCLKSIGRDKFVRVEWFGDLPLALFDLQIALALSIQVL